MSFIRLIVCVDPSLPSKARARLRRPKSAIASPPSRMDANEAQAILLHIEGWNPPLPPDESMHSLVSISISSSWRAAWR